MARTNEIKIQGTGSETLFVRITENNDLEIRIGNKGRYQHHFSYGKAYMALWRARNLVSKLNCSNLRIMAYPGGIKNIPSR